MEVRRDNGFPTLIEFFDARGAAVKRLTQRGLERRDGYWFARELEMEDLRSGHRTRLVVREIRFDVGLSDDFFSRRTLER